MDEHKELFKKTNLIVVCGATATGKSAAAIKLAKRLDTEIISADSMQIYKGLNVGTAKITPSQMQGVKHHLIDILEPSCPYSVADFLRQSKPIISELQSENKIPIVCGGTGLYISSLIDGLTLSKEQENYEEKRQLYSKYQRLSIDDAYLQLLKIDPEYAVTIHKNNSARVSRALTLFEKTGITMSQQIKSSKPATKPYNETTFNLCYQDKNIHYGKIESRIDEMLNNGLLQEAKYVFENQESFKTAVAAIGYKELFGYFKDEITLEQAAIELKTATRKYAKRQKTWFKRLAPQVNVPACENIDLYSLLLF